MDKTLEKRLENIKKFINNGYTADTKTGAVYSFSRKFGSNELKQRGSICKHSGYVKICTKINGKGLNICAHLLVYYLATGKVVDELDHINRNKTDNRIENLREVTHGENQQNKNTLGYSYRPDRNKFRARISVNKTYINLGHYDTEEEAKEAYLKAKEKYHI